MKRMMYLMVLAVLAFSCSKEEGEGGNSVITGKVFAKIYNNSFTHLLDSFYVPDADVYIIYGSNKTYSDRYSTNWDGTYRFEYLRKGNYRVFVYSADTSGNSASGLVPVIADVHVPGNNETVHVQDLITLDKCDYDEGTSSVTGKVWVVDKNAERTDIIAEYYGADEDVFIVYGDDPFHFDDVKTYHDGTFRFENLVKGTYTVYALSDPFARMLIPVSKTVTIYRDFQHIVISDSLVIIK
ncbi:MAG: hypothetical protein JW723_07450 [Bacteroidales bacterium]|nr:hypothetical protein [Bacteroidales bacterium]